MHLRVYGHHKLYFKKKEEEVTNLCMQGRMFDLLGKGGSCKYNQNTLNRVLKELINMVHSFLTRLF